MSPTKTILRNWYKICPRRRNASISLVSAIHESIVVVTATDMCMVVANAGVSGPKAEPDKSEAEELKAKLWNNESVEDWDKTWRTDVTSVYFTTVAFLPLLQAAVEPKGPGEKFSASVITTSSMSGIMRPAQGQIA